ncbi:CAAX farnesyltransferase (FTase) subunit beta [Tilletia horrida]|nr:CAAX farnesyltransferase (FTase) subunit beta [Tilletia horrida]KAK0565700.1 CAAX farnesyltransferase (FTase) subunit beta [Tilletia horrida]
MSATRQALWATPDDRVYTETSNAQLDVERTIAQLLLPYHVGEPEANQAAAIREPALHNPWLDPSPRSAASPAVAATDVPEAGPSSGSTAAGDGAAPTQNPERRKPQPPPTLNRQAHLAFVSEMLGPLPAAFTASFDTNRSWIQYWTIHTWDLLGAAFDPTTRARAIATLLSFQHPDGGFGGGPDQIPHLMNTYPAVCALAIVGGPGPAPTPEDVKAGKSVEVGRGGWDAINRAGLYRWMMSLKQPDGSFVVHQGGEVDVRASYCVTCVSILLGICTPELVSGMKDFIVSCQTYEGGLAASSYPESLGQSLAQLGEAHGGYAHCALASYLSLLGLEETYQEIASDGIDEVSNGIDKLDLSRGPDSRTLDLDALLRWACSQQGLAIELGAFRGRTNKLVDGCYGWFGGAGLFAVLDACLVGERGKRRKLPQGNADDLVTTQQNGNPVAKDTASTSAEEEDWSTESEEEFCSTTVSDDWLFDPIALQEYILIAAQVNSSGGAVTGRSGGGLRDKPGKRPDPYHTCYNLSGLSLCQHRCVRSKEMQVLLEKIWKTPSTASGPTTSTDQPTIPNASNAWRKACYVSALSWQIEPRANDEPARVVGNPKTNEIRPTHPIFNLTFPKVKGMLDWAYQQGPRSS